MSEYKNRFTVLSLFKSVRSTMLFLFSLLIVMTMVIFLLISVNYTKRTVLENSTGRFSPGVPGHGNSRQHHPDSLSRSGQFWKILRITLTGWSGR